MAPATVNDSLPWSFEIADTAAITGRGPVATGTMRARLVDADGAVVAVGLRAGTTVVITHPALDAALHPHPVYAEVPVTGVERFRPVQPAWVRDGENIGILLPPGTHLAAGGLIQPRLRTYRGSTSGSERAHVIEVLGPDGEATGMLAPTSVLRLFPGEFSWGYGGSGPRSTAEALLVDHMGQRLRCPSCRGSGRVRWTWSPDGDGQSGTYTPAAGGDDTEPCIAGCTAGILLDPGLVHRFKAEHVATWPQDGGFELTSTDIDLWLDRQPDVPRGC